MDIVDKLSNTAVEKKEEILNILQGVLIKDAELALSTALYAVKTCLDEQKKATVFYDNQIFNDWLSR